MTKAEQIAQFDPEGVGHTGRLFGLPFTPDTAEVVLIPIPWEVTVSYGAGTARGPQAILDASPQIDYHLMGLKDAWKLGIAMEDISEEMARRSDLLRQRTEPYIAWLEEGHEPQEAPEEFARLVREVNDAGEMMCKVLAKKAQGYLEQGKIVGVIGGDHSSPLGLMQAVANQYEAFGILQVDAHADLRNAYEGFSYSHASIMTNALTLPQVSKLVQVGVRDYSIAEYTQTQVDERIACFFGQELRIGMANGVPWQRYVDEICDQLPEHVYISFDIDGLDPSLCPNTGTPVPDGLWLHEVIFLFQELVRKGKKIVGFDLVEVAPTPDSEWDGNVGARVLYPLATWAGASWGKVDRV